MNILLWIIFGGVAGWIASVLTGTDGSQGTIANIVVGIIGAIIGGYIMQYFGKSGVTGFNLYSLVVSIVGAVVLIALARLVM